MIGRMVFVLSVTPVGPMRQRIVTTAFYQGSRLAFYIGKRVLHEQYYQVGAETHNLWFHLCYHVNKQEKCFSWNDFHFTWSQHGASSTKDTVNSTACLKKVLIVYVFVGQMTSSI